MRHLDACVSLGRLALRLQGVLGLVAQRHEGQEKHICQELHPAAHGECRILGMGALQFVCCA